MLLGLLLLVLVNADVFLAIRGKGRLQNAGDAAALAAVGDCADVVADGGVSPGGEASTVVRIGAESGIEILRQGAMQI